MFGDIIQKPGFSEKTGFLKYSINYALALKR
jgi:hypothetical protein